VTRLALAGLSDGNESEGDVELKPGDAGVRANKIHDLQHGASDSIRSWWVSATLTLSMVDAGSPDVETTRCSDEREVSPEPLVSTSVNAFAYVAGTRVSAIIKGEHIAGHAVRRSTHL
jgi:hypothetical protein